MTDEDDERPEGQTEDREHDGSEARADDTRPAPASDPPRADEEKAEGEKAGGEKAAEKKAAEKKADGKKAGGKKADGKKADGKKAEKRAEKRAGKKADEKTEKKTDRRAAAAKKKPSGGPFVRCVRLTKWYGKVSALQDVSLHLEPGIWGLLGPNGSGKTTLLRLVAGQLKPSLGEVRIGEERPFANPEALRRIGLCPEQDALYDDLTGLEFVTAMAEMSGYDREEAARRAKQALEEFGLVESMNRKMGGYSRGMRQRAKLAQCMVHEPDVLLLDEPLTGTDPTSRAVILDRIRRRAEEGAIVLFSTHVLHEVEALTDQVLLIARGQVVAQGQVHEIRELLEEHPHHVRVVCDRPRELGAALAAEPGILGMRFPWPGAVDFETHQPDGTYAAIAKTAVEQGFKVASLTSPDATLEALFHYLVERSGRMAGTGSDAAVGAHQALTAPHQEAQMRGQAEEAQS